MNRALVNIPCTIQLANIMSIEQNDGNLTIRAIAVTDGKGDVDKASVSTNLAVAMAELGHEVMLLDANLSLANIAVLLSLHPKRNLSHVIQ